MSRRRRIPVIHQMETADCGVACLAMVLEYFGRSVTLDEVRQVTGSGRDGLNALSLLNAGRWFGLEGNGASFDLDHLPHLETGTILFWNFNHFVVFERMKKKAIQIVDPAWGRRWITMEQFSESFTGIGIMMKPGEGFQTVKSARPSSWQYLLKMMKYPGLITQIMLTSVFIQLFTLALPILTGVLIDRVLPIQNVDLLKLLGLGLLAMVLFQFLSTLVRYHLLLYLRIFMDRRMTTDFMMHLVSLPYAFFQTRSTGDLMNRVTSHIHIRGILTSGALSGLLDGILVMVYLVLMLVTYPLIGFLTLGLGLLQVLVFLLSHRRYRELTSQGLDAQARSQGALVQILSGLETVKASGLEHQAVKQWSDLFVHELQTTLTRGRLTATVDAMQGGLRMASPLVILYVGGLQVLEGELSLGIMLALSALAGSFIGPLSTLLSTAMQFQQIRSYLERIYDVMEKKPEQDLSLVGPIGQLQGAIELEKVSFRYGLQAPLAVDEVSVTIQPGQFVAIVGRSGSGKSTLASLLSGLNKPTAGKITFDGQDMEVLDLRSLRQRMGIVPQHPFLFSGTIRSNIAMIDSNSSMDAMIRAAKLAQIHKDIMEMPMQYETFLAEGGASVSGGQRQRLALARALIHEPAILLLDEATSALDTVTESLVQEALASLHCTRIVIAQRLSTITMADVILVMEDGRIVEQGTHAELLARQGKYAQLVGVDGE